MQGAVTVTAQVMAGGISSSSPELQTHCVSRLSKQAFKSIRLIRVHGVQYAAWLVVLQLLKCRKVNLTVRVV